jgi:ribonuclease VapC
MSSGSDIFVDASALLAIILEEPSHERFVDIILRSRRRLTSPIALLEVAAKLAGKLDGDVQRCESTISRLVERLDLDTLDIDAETGRLSRDALYRFGKGRHRARLNLGDCFAYACAQRHGLALLFKGDDFIHTDIEPALKSGS